MTINWGDTSIEVSPVVGACIVIVLGILICIGAGVYLANCCHKPTG